MNRATGEGVMNCPNADFCFGVKCGAISRRNASA
jgi:hypothetical protein